jgi:hypothetical protein
LQFSSLQQNFWSLSVAKTNICQEISNNILHAPFQILVTNLVATKKGFGCHPTIKPSQLATKTHFGHHK